MPRTSSSSATTLRNTPPRLCCRPTACPSALGQRSSGQATPRYTRICYSSHTGVGAGVLDSGDVLDLVHGRSRMATDPPIPTMPGHGARRVFTDQAGIAFTKEGGGGIIIRTHEGLKKTGMAAYPPPVFACTPHLMLITVFPPRYVGDRSS